MRYFGYDAIVDDGDSIQATYDGGATHIGVLNGYDPTVDSYPLVFDEDRPFAIEGCGPGVSQLGHEEADDGPIVDVVGHGARTYKRAPTIQNLSVVGGSPGIRIRCAPYASLSNVYVTAEGDGVVVATGEHNCYGTTMFNVQAWNCGGDGFRLETDAGPHATQFFGCQAIANKGVGFRLDGYKTSIFGGSSQMNHGHGIDVRSPAVSIKDAYIEGNGRREDYPVELYGHSAHGLTVADCYFHGATPREVWHDHDDVQRAINVHESRSVSLRDNVFRGYADAFFAGFDTKRERLQGNFALDQTSLRSG